MTRRKRRTKAQQRAINRQRDSLKRRGNYLNALLGKTKKADQLLVKLKREHPREVLRLFDMLSGHSTALAMRIGVPFPATYAEISNTLTVPFSGDVCAELTWELAVLSRYVERLNHFLKAKGEFEHLLLKGDYDCARQSLEDIVRTQGCSLWSASAGILVSEYAEGLAGNREFVESMGSQLQNSNVLLHGAFFSERAEKNLSTSSYDENVRNSFAKSWPSQSLVGIVANMWFTLDFASFGRYDRLAEVLYYGSLFPIVDRYATFVRVLQCLVCLRGCSVPLPVASIVSVAASRFCDSRIRMLLHLLEPDTTVVQTDSLDLLAEITDHYTTGEYHQASEIAESALLQHSDCLEFYELFAKALLHLDEPLRNPFPEGTVSHELLLNVHTVLTKQDTTPRSLEFLRKLSYAFDSTRLASQVLAFVANNSVSNDQLDYRLFGGINGIAPSARFATCFCEPADGIRFLSGLQELYPENSAAAFFSEILERPNVEIENALLVTVPLARRLKYRAALRLQQGDFIDAIGEYEAFRREVAGKMPFQEDVVRGLFDAYLSAAMYDQCVRLVVDTYLSSRHLLSSIRLKDCLDVSLDYDANRDASEICWSIFYSICHREGLLADGLWDVYVQYDEFLMSYGVVKPSDLLAKADDFGRRRFVCFLRDVCIPQVMDNSPLAFATTKELEEERIVLCQSLQEFDPENAEEYSREIHELMRRGMIRESIRNVDRSKVYIDTAGIAKSLSDLSREKFQRCLLFASLDERLRRTPAVRQVLSKDNATRVIVWTDMGFEAFKEVFDDIKRPYIFSNEYGLDSYISVRVRHGTLSGQIRSQFETEHLITRLNTETGLYDENKYWQEDTFNALGQDISVKATTLLTEFSKEVDGIIDIVKNRWLQIKGEQNGFEGLFDFDYSYEQLVELWAKLFVKDEVASFESFIAAIFAELNYRTTQNLARVQTHVREELRNKLTRALDKLGSAVQQLHHDLHRSQFATSLTRCRTNIQNELETIAGWFENFEQVRAPDFEFGHLVDTTIEMVKKCYRSHRLKPQLDLQAGLSCLGVTFTSFIDIMFIILENVAKHSTSDGADAIAFTLSAVVVDEQFRIEVSNAIPESVDIVELRHRLDQLREQGRSGVSDRFIRAEGGSGYWKLLKIVRHDLAREEYDVSFDVSNENRFVARIHMPTEGITICGS